MTSVADSIGIRSHGIAGATVATLDLTGTITAKMYHFAIARIAAALGIRAEGFVRNDLRESRGRSQKEALVT